MRTEEVKRREGRLNEGRRRRWNRCGLGGNRRGEEGGVTFIDIYILMK